MRHPTACCFHHGQCHTIMGFYFGAADLQLLLATAGVRNIMLAGVTTDVCVHTTMRVRCCGAAHPAQPLGCAIWGTSAWVWHLQHLWQRDGQSLACPGSARSDVQLCSTVSGSSDFNV